MTHKHPLHIVLENDKGDAVTEQKPVITFHAELKTDLTPDQLFAVLADLNTHLIWAGKESKFKGFHLLDLKAPGGPASVGTTWTSDGANSANGSMTFHDRSTVVQADAGKAFGFDTESTLDRKSGKTWYCHFEHRYTIRPAEGGSIITYTCDVFPKNYKPYWLQPFMRPMTRAMVRHAHTKHMRNLARMAGARATAPRSA
jgi:Polyketide cyclase / dehydrase and lipid transport